MVDFNAMELGNVIGLSMKQANDYKQDMAETGEINSITIAPIEPVKITETYFVKKQIIGGCSEIPFVIDHPVYGELDSSTLYIDGGYCSAEYVEFNSSYVNVADESGNFLTDSGKLIINFE